MSEFTLNKKERIRKLLEVSKLVLETGNARRFFLEDPDFITQVIPSDFIALFDELVKEGYETSALKTCSNKILNLFYKSVSEHKRLEPKPDSFLWILEQNNQKMEEFLNKIRPLFKTLNENNADKIITAELISYFEELEKFTSHYTIKENVLFPVIEKTWPDYRCLQIMWSFHDEIRKNIKYILEKLKQGIENQKEFNRKVGDIFFQMSAIKFREERILFPEILLTVNEEELKKMSEEGIEIGFPFVQPENMKSNISKNTINSDSIDLETGALNIEQIKLIFNRLPVDITFVDEHNKVCFFSSPEKRIFPRTKAIIGREVKNCHPPESVHIVEQIVESFRKGEKNHAEFRIKMKGEYVLIQYFALRDKLGNYKGVIEVTQEITNIKKMEGEKRILDW